MKRLTVLGLCLVAAFALSVLVAASAMAAKTEHGPMIVTSSGGEAHLGTSEGTITSTSNAGKGELTSASGGTSESTFFGVEFKGVKCNSSGQATGVVKTELLTEGVGWITKNVEAGVDFKPASGPNLAEFVCGGTILVKVHGSVIGHATNNVAGLTSKLNLISAPSGKANSPEQFDGGAKDILLSNIAGLETGESVQVQEGVTITNHGNSSVCKIKEKNGVKTEKCKPASSGELSIVSGTPEFGRCNKGGSKTYTDSSCTLLPAPGKKGKYSFAPLPN